MRVCITNTVLIMLSLVALYHLILISQYGSVIIKETLTWLIPWEIALVLSIVALGIFNLVKFIKGGGK